MKFKTKKTKTFLGPSDFRKGTKKGLKKYKKLNFLEQYSMYMGVAQLLEFILKQLLQDRYDYDIDKMEKWTLGRVSAELKNNKLREEFFLLLDPVISDRNYITHELLASDYIFHAVLKSNKSVYTKEKRRLSRAIYELEQLFFLVQWCNNNNGWD